MRSAWWVLLALFPAGVAVADMIPEMPPSDCPSGSVYRQSHEGSYCQPLSCASDKDCAPEQACQSQSLCIVSSTYHGRPDGREYTRESAAGACGADKSCAAGTCSVAKRCAAKGSATATQADPPESQPDAPATTPAPAGKLEKAGRCSVEPGADSAAAGWLFGAAGLAGLWRGRRARRHARS